ncbi:hypothetical protein BDZ94DRAFT_1263145 [Collybia nuda]|uniref:Uncharacterized protein n=1 Tax=Collybia nuda TaxID=64659 RepID=A0A9P6CIA5_9AGAR|nr:hypothetical protein BDZ94DRAFT_1263145 [Collybia nuda]
MGTHPWILAAGAADCAKLGRAILWINYVELNKYLSPQLIPKAIFFYIASLGRKSALRIYGAWTRSPRPTTLLQLSKRMA